MSDFPIDTAQLVALFLESLFYGIYIVTFGMCIQALLFTGRAHASRRYYLLIVALLLFTFATLDVAFLLRHVLDAFIWYKGPGGPKEEFADISYWVNAMKSMDYAVQTGIGDAMLIYRCYIIYGRDWKIAAGLSALWVGGMITVAFACYIEFTLHQNAFLNVGRLTPFITSALSITLGLNLIATFMIIYKLWSIRQRSAEVFIASMGNGHGGGALMRAMRIMIESGAMYTISVIVFFVVYLASNNAQYGVSDCVVQIIGIAFNLVIIRVQQGRAIETSIMRASRTTRTESNVKGNNISLNLIPGLPSGDTGPLGSADSSFVTEGTSMDREHHKVGDLLQGESSERSEV